jgi:hypothetical protein
MQVRSYPAHRRNGATSSAYSEIGTAAMVHPDASLIVAPTVALLAPRIASLPGHLHTTPHIRGAIVASAIVGRTGDRLASAIVSAVVPIVPTVHHEVSAATVIYPDPIAVIAPAITLRTGRSASLVGHLHAAARIDRTGMPPAIVG